MGKNTGEKASTCSGSSSNSSSSCSRINVPYLLHFLPSCGRFIPHAYFVRSEVCMYLRGLCMDLISFIYIY